MTIHKYSSTHGDLRSGRKAHVAQAMGLPQALKLLFLVWCFVGLLPALCANSDLGPIPFFLSVWTP